MPELSVIAATDLSTRSEHVAGRAARIARDLGARLIVAHVCPPEGSAPPALLVPLSKARGDAHTTARQALQRIAERVGAEARALEGEAPAALAELARTENAALLVLGLHRERRVLDLLRLTTMERIVLRAPCPALIARSAPEHDYRCVLAPTDFSRASAEALIVAARLAPKAERHAVHALQMPLGSIFRPGHAETEAQLASADERMQAFLATPGLPALTEPPVVVPGGVHEVLEFRRQDLGADLLAIGANPGPDPRVLGNYARDLMRAPQADLLVAKPPVQAAPT
ncbi:MAG: hypothetical protein Kow0013_12540 [Pararhodobacter sp.]